MKRFSDEEILGMYAPRGLGPPIGEGEQVACVRMHCGRVGNTPGTRAYRWAPRLTKGAVIELCPRCHNELARIISGG